MISHRTRRGFIDRLGATTLAAATLDLRSGALRMPSRGVGAHAARASRGRQPARFVTGGIDGVDSDSRGSPGPSS
ncbi:hypothetical protein, partial [Microbacterium sp. B24]|uniref:hypothetical protein n=1 Tax=Microbacterium sp. B24 TaxID=95616 RepID=UPI0019552E5B